MSTSPHPSRTDARGAENSDWTSHVYDELRRMADALLMNERRNHTLEPTALAHEVWLRLFASRTVGELDRGAFLGVASLAMRRILTDHARRRGAHKRGGRARRTTMDGRPARTEPGDFLLDVNAALDELAAIDAELVRVVELRFYSGFSTADSALALGVSERTIKRRWRFARAWLQQRLEEQAS